MCISCEKKDDEIQQYRSGYFLLTQIKNPDLKNTQTNTDEPIKSEFLLGDLKASKEFYFLLSNGGENPIFDIQLKTDNLQFTIIPERISILDGEYITIRDNIIPLISLGIIHGTQLNGVGYTNLLSMGENSSILTITGKTVENEDTIDLKSEFSFKINSKIMDIRIYENEQEINLLNPTGSVSSNYGGLGFIRYYSVTSNSIKIKNTGNVHITINVTAMDEFGNDVNLNDISLPSDQSSDINLSYFFTLLTLDSNGTITDDSRIQLGNNGKGYIVLLKSNE